MRCKICKENNIQLIYDGPIRNGKVCNDTHEHVPIYQCKNCGTIWHEKVERNYAKYYESLEYRKELEDATGMDEFYRLHDFETLDKFQYTGTDIYRNKTVADIGCGGGAFLDFLKGVAAVTIGIEPSEYYRKELEKKGHIVYSYADKAKEELKNKIDVITSFDVIEHVEDPIRFMKDIYELLSPKGEAIIGTPTEAPILRQLVGTTFERQLLFSIQHLWIFGEKSLSLIARKAGFEEISIKFKQRYGIGNLIAWLQTNEPKGHISYEFLTETLDVVWKNECCEQGLADYILIYLKKENTSVEFDV